MGDFIMHAENVDMHSMYGRVNGNGRAALRMQYAQFPDRIFQQVHRQLRETHSFHVTRHDVGRQRAVRSPVLEESVLNNVVV
ncbi:hypothetical protein TNCV_497791 [Trichonephila clavipes]|nr:hypothetical protein TNCV_497791 [Trichonephila clavipes]